MIVSNESPALPLAAIKAFEAAARLGSFTAAARELGLTQSAISRHVRTLEDGFALTLFSRSGRSVALTEAGKSYFGPVAEGMRLIRMATNELARRRRSTNRLTISLLPSVAALWLAPRLADFTARNPKVELHIRASRLLVDFGVEDVDVGIRYGLGDWPDVRSERLASETLTPVCSPDFARLHRLGGDPRALFALPLLSDDIVDQWCDWFGSVNVAAPPPAGARVNDSASLYHAAAAGLGIALGRSLLVERALRDGQLVAPFAHCIPATYSYWAVRPVRGEPSPIARLFLRWAREQMSEAERRLEPPDWQQR